MGEGGVNFLSSLSYLFIFYKYSYDKFSAAWGYHRQGYCQAGFSAAATKVVIIIVIIVIGIIKIILVIVIITI